LFEVVRHLLVHFGRELFDLRRTLALSTPVSSRARPSKIVASLLLQDAWHKPSEAWTGAANQSMDRMVVSAHLLLVDAIHRGEVHLGKRNLWLDRLVGVHLVYLLGGSFERNEQGASARKAGCRCGASKSAGRRQGSGVPQALFAWSLLERRCKQKKL